MRSMTTSEARKDFSETVKRARKGERIVLNSHGKPVAALVPIEDLELLQELEDRLDARAARIALAEAQEHGTIPWGQVKAELGL